MTDTGGALPLLASQLGVWFAHHIDPAGHAYNVGEYLVIHGPIDPMLFDTAARHVAEEVEALRVRFGETEGEPWQQVSAGGSRSVSFFDVTSAACPQDAALDWMRADITRPVDLIEDPLVMWALFKVAPDRFLWYHRYHHILLDGVSLSLIVRRMAEMYTALVRGVPPGESGFGSLRELVEDDNASRASTRFADDRDYWRSRLAGSPEPPRLGLRPPQTHGTVLRRSSYLAPSVLTDMRATAWKAGTSWPALVIATTAAYLHRMTGLSDVVVGLPVSGRTSPIAKRTPGMMTNVLPVRLAVRTDTMVTELLKSTSKTVHTVLRHQQYRYEDLLRELRPSGNDHILTGPEVNIMSFGYGVCFAGYPITAHNLSNGPVNDLTISVYDRNNDQQIVRVDFDANSGIYHADELADHQQRFMSLLEAVVADPDRPVGRIGLLPTGERHRPRVDDYDTSRTDSATTFPMLFERQVHRTPDPTPSHRKLDRDALPAPDLTATAPDRAPRSPHERLLCELFAELLGLDRVGVQDGFFTLGGDSIIAAQLVSRARRAGVLISFRDVFEHRTVAELAAVAR